jgi:hypothetical protein
VRPRCFLAHFFQFIHRSFYRLTLYSMIRKSLRDFRTLQYSSRDGHAEGRHVNEKETLQVFVLPYRWSIAPFCCVYLGCCAADIGSSGGTYELPCVFKLHSALKNQQRENFFLVEDIPICLSIILKWNKMYTSSNSTIL